MSAGERHFAELAIPRMDAFDEPDAADEMPEASIGFVSTIVIEPTFFPILDGLEPAGGLPSG